MERLKVKDLVPKQEVKSIFLVKYIAVAEARDGKKYLNIVLADGTGDIEGRSWSKAEDIFESCPKGSFVSVAGKVNLFQGRKQFIVQNIHTVDKAELDMSEFIHKSDRSEEDMYAELLGIVSELKDVYIKELLHSMLTDQEIARRIKKWQAGKSIHHAYQSGLLEHILSCANLAMSLSNVYGVNQSYVVAGAIVHDICKIYELTDDMNVEYTEEGKLVGHLVKGVELLDRFAYRIKDFPYQMKLHLKHILLSHHGEYAYGSPKIPQTSEAMLVHLIDLMDSKMHSFETVKRNDNNSGHWTGFVKHLDRIIFKDELPTYTEFISNDGGEIEKEKTDKPKSKKIESKPTKGALADALKDFKV